MIKTLTKLMQKGGLERFTLKYYSPGVEAAWTIDDDSTSDPSLQIVYRREYTINGEEEKEDYWLYFAPEDAAAIGSVLVAWAAQHGEKA